MLTLSGIWLIEVIQSSRVTTSLHIRTTTKLQTHSKNNWMDFSWCRLTDSSVGSALPALLVEQASLKQSELDAHPVRSNIKQLLRSLDQLCPFEPDGSLARLDYVRSFFDYINTLASVVVRSLGSEGKSSTFNLLHMFVRQKDSHLVMCPVSWKQLFSVDCHVHQVVPWVIVFLIFLLWFQLIFFFLRPEQWSEAWESPPGFASTSFSASVQPAVWQTSIPWEVWSSGSAPPVYEGWHTCMDPNHFMKSVVSCVIGCVYS